MPSQNTKYCHACQAELANDERVCPFCHKRQQTRLESSFFKGMSLLFPKYLPTTKLLIFGMVIFFIVICIDIIMHPDFGIKEALLSPPGELIYRWGAHVRGELIWWRLITANFIHIGILHIVFNLYALRYVSPYIERTYGSPLTFAAFVVLGTVSMLCSNIFGGAGIVAGASGSLMGFIGLAAVAAHRENTSLSKEVRDSMLKWAALTMIVGIAVSASGTMGIDNIAHAAGFIVGAGLGFVLPRQTTTGFTHLWMIRTSRLSCLLALFVSCYAFILMGAASESTKYQKECISGIKHRMFEKAETKCELAFKADRTQMISWHNYILINIINGHRKKAEQLCTDGRKQFSRHEEEISFDSICQSIEH